MFLKKILLQSLITLKLRDRRFNTGTISTQGFTLVEILVSMVILGVLAAIAVPSYLNQTQKARFAEAKTYVLNMNRLQQAFYMEKGTFADDISRLSLGNTSSASYSYIVLTGNTNGNSNPPQLDRIVTNVAKPNTSNLNPFAGVLGVTIPNSGQVNIDTIYCASVVTGSSTTAFGKISGDGLRAECPTNFYPL